MTLCLTEKEMIEITGRKYAKYQIVWLTNNAWKFFVNADGAPKVARGYAEQRMGVVTDTKRRVVRVEGLNRRARSAA